ncbi:hypothetical protein [Nigerium massiliense]|uniref:hypothetical protein n=1 Tax=Nigerium massiliense TaxID=1522317 RepID=UPI0006944141|nr:hypothetical protein [Nigerium massiliense]
MQQVDVDLYLPDPEIKVAPDPSVNEWNMAVVGYPLWLWVPTADSVESSATNDGLTFDMTATRKSVTFDMGDGSTVTCEEMTPFDDSVEPGTPSPTCGYVYQKPSLPNENYTVRATTEWTVRWSSMGFSGDLPGTTTSTTTIPVGELQSVLRR